MVFSSLVFLFRFLPIFLLSYFIVTKTTKSLKAGNLILFLFSLFFYGWGEPIYISLMLFSTVFDYFNGLLIEKFGHKTLKSKIVLIISLIGNLGLLGIFKYSDWFISNVNSLANTNIPLLNLALPIGISFYTFQTLSYTIDVYRGIVPAQHNIISFGAYVTMFPQLIAGPIVQFKTIAEELNERKINPENINYGIRRFCIGLCKKIIIANNVGYIWSQILENYSTSSTLTLWLGIVCFALQIYFDFSGYSDMAIGLGKILGFNFLENFNYPYISKSITEFWRRWHISLGTWFREYVYIPLGGNKKGLKRQIINLSIVWLLTGFWHGAAWNYILWGVYYGIILIIEKIFLLKLLNKLPSVFSHIYTIFMVLIGWCLFAIEDFSILLPYFTNLFNFNNFIDNQFLYYLENYGILLLISIISSLNIGKIIHDKYIANNKQLLIIENILIIFLVIICISMLVSSTYNPFLYFRF